MMRRKVHFVMYSAVVPRYLHVIPVLFLGRSILDVLTDITHIV